MASKLQLKERHPAQASIIRDAVRFNVLACGRRFGKTDLFEDISIDGLTPEDPRSMINGGRVGWWVGKQDQFALVWKRVSDTLFPVSQKQDAKEHQIWLWPQKAGQLGGMLKFWSLFSGPDAGRGWEFDRAIIDEAAHTKHLQKAWEYTILPTLAITRGDAFFGSSPNGKKYFHRLFQQGDTTSPYYRAGWRSWQMPSIASPYVTAEEVEEQRRNMAAEVFAQEWEAKFIDGAAGWFQSRWLQWYHTAYDQGELQVVILCDPASGRSKTEGDFTVFWVIGLDALGNYYCLDFVRERFDLVERTQCLFELHQTFQPTAVGYEQYGMQSDIEHIYTEMERKKYRFPIQELGGNIPKPVRIQRLVGPIKTGKLYLPSNRIMNIRTALAVRALMLWIDTEFVEYAGDGSSDTDDGLDCLARIFDIDVTRPNSTPAPEATEHQEAVYRPIAQERNVIQSDLQV